MKPALGKFKFKRDMYAKKRGASSMLVIACVTCNSYVMSYQKDGPGPLLRCYLDRIHHPENLMLRQYELFDKNTSLQLACDSCKTVVGIPIIYEKENRPAYHMKVGLFSAKRFKAKS